MRYFVTFVIASVWFLVGMIDTNQYTTERITTNVKAGDTIDTIAARHFDKDQSKMTWAEFRDKALEDNRALENKNRHLQIGDKVVIKIAKRVD